MFNIIVLLHQNQTDNHFDWILQEKCEQNVSVVSQHRDLKYVKYNLKKIKKTAVQHSKLY